jgi:phage antirepressor YoqD-like protein
MQLTTTSDQKISSGSLLETMNRLRAEHGESPIRLNDFHTRVADELEGEHYESFVVTNANQTTSRRFMLTHEQVMLVAMRESKAVRRGVRDAFKALEAKQSFSVPATLSEALRLAADQADKIESQAKRLEVSEPKAAALDLIAQAAGELCLTDAAKHLQVAPRMLTAWMQAHSWIYKRHGGGSWVAYQDKISQGLLLHRRVEVKRTAGFDVTWQALVTPKGIAAIAKSLASSGLLTA